MAKYVQEIPIKDIKKVEMYLGLCKKSLSSVVSYAKSNADKMDCIAHVINAGMWNPNGSACPLLKVSGKWISKDAWNAYGFAWDSGPDIKVTTDKSAANFWATTALIAPGVGSIKKLSYDKNGQGGSRPRSAVGINNTSLFLYCSSTPMTPEALRDDCAKRGYTGAVMGDGGGSTQCWFGSNSKMIRGDGRKCHNYLIVYQKKSGSSPVPSNDTKKEDTNMANYKVTPSAGVNVRSGPGTSYSKVGTLSCGAVVAVSEVKSGWGKISTGWVSLSYMAAVSAQAASAATSSSRKTDTGLVIERGLIPSGRKNRPGGSNPDKYITVHETGNPSKGADAAAHVSYLSSDAAVKEMVSWHYTVDDHSIYQHIPDNEKAYHAGDGKDGAGNATSIGIEICVNADGDFEKAKKNAAALVRLLMKEHSIPVANVVQHYHWNKKDCPYTIRHTSGEWDRFLSWCKGSVDTSLADAVDVLKNAGVLSSADYWKSGSGYSDSNVVALIKAMAKYVKE